MLVKDAATAVFLKYLQLLYVVYLPCCVQSH